MTAEHAYELPPGAESGATLSRAVHDAEDGEVAYLTREGLAVAAVVPLAVAAAGAAAIEALEDAHDTAEADRVLAAVEAGAPTRPWREIRDELDL